MCFCCALRFGVGGENHVSGKNSENHQQRTLALSSNFHPRPTHSYGDPPKSAGDADGLTADDENMADASSSASTSQGSHFHAASLAASGGRHSLSTLDRPDGAAMCVKKVLLLHTCSVFDDLANPCSLHVVSGNFVLNEETKWE